MARAKVKLNSAGVEELLHSAGVRAEVTRRAEAGAAAARAIAPVRSGAYLDSIHVEVEDHPTRVVARVVAEVSYAMVVESRTGTLAKALGSAGGA